MTCQRRSSLPFEASEAFPDIRGRNRQSIERQSKLSDYSRPTPHGRFHEHADFVVLDNTVRKVNNRSKEDVHGGCADKIVYRESSSRYRGLERHWSGHRSRARIGWCVSHLYVLKF